MLYLNPQFDALGLVSRHAPTVPVEHTQAVEACRVARLGGLVEPVCGLCIVLLHAAPVEVAGAKVHPEAASDMKGLSDMKAYIAVV